LIDILKAHYVWIVALISVVALAIRLWFNLDPVNLSLAGVADASEYLRYCQVLQKLDIFHPDFSGWKEFVISGPTFPVFLSLCASLCGASFAAGSAAITISLVVQAFTSTAIVVLLILVVEMLWGKRSACIAGAAAALYPGFIVNAARLYSESFATTLEMGALYLGLRAWFASNEKSRNLYLAFTGFLLIALQLTRSSMMLLTLETTGILVLALVFAAIKNRAALKPRAINLAAFVAGCIVVIAPWFVLQKSAFNKTSFVVDRVGQYNLFIGTNTAIQGFLSYPYPDGSGIEKKSYTQLIREAYKESPSRFLRLMMDKPARLYKFPWNDFRTPIGIFAFKWQVLYHEIVLMLALLGTVLCVFLDRQKAAGKKIIGRLFFFSLLAVNLPFLLFITVPRYNLMAMPVLLGIAAVGAYRVAQLNKYHQASIWPKLAVLCPILLLLFFRDDLSRWLDSGDFIRFISVRSSDALGRILFCGVVASTWCVSLYKCSKNLEGYIWPFRFAFAIYLIFFMPLALMQQRANGRSGETVIEMAKKGECIKSEFVLAEGRKLPTGLDWYVAVDGDNGHLQCDRLSLSLGERPVNTAPLPALSLLDDWSLSKMMDAGCSYLECAWIFDCLSAPSGVTNTELRQWHFYPVGNIVKVAEILNRERRLPIEMSQKDGRSLKLFSRKKVIGKKTNTLPGRYQYSWEKAFYGVENDEGLTDTRYDESVEVERPNAGSWQIELNRETAGNMIGDTNVMLVGVPQIARKAHDTMSDTVIQKSARAEDAVLQLDMPLPEPASRRPALLSVSYEAKSVANIKDTPSTRITDLRPVLRLDYRVEQDGRMVARHMFLPWLKPLIGTNKYSVSLPIDLQGLRAHDCKVSLTFADRATRPDKASMRMQYDVRPPLFVNQKEIVL
jgi:hypothetical protein